MIPNEIDLNIIVGVRDRRRQPRVQGGRNLQWGFGGSASDSNNTTGEEEEEEKRYEVDELWKLPVEKGEEGAFRPRSNDCHTDDHDGDEQAKSARPIMLPKHFV